MSAGARALLKTVAHSPRLRLAVLLVLLLGLSAVMVVVGGPSKSGVQRVVEGSGVAAPIVYVVLYAVLTVLLFPVSVITAAGGVLFGAIAATALTVVAATAGATVAFLTGRRLGRNDVQAIAGRHVGRLDDLLERRGFLAVLYLRLIPIVPFNALNYAAGVTSVRLRDYIAATAIGIIPGTYAYAALGSTIDRPTSPQFWAAVALLLVLAVGAPLVGRWMSRRRGREPTAPALTARAASETENRR